MAAPTLNRRELANTRSYFIPVGETVDAVTVSKTTWPDNVPLTNYTVYELLEIETTSVETELETETFQIPKDSGGYKSEDENTILSKKWTVTTARANSYIKKLEHGLLTVPVVGVAQAPNVNNNNYIDGVLLTETQIRSGTMTESTQVWARMTLAEVPETGPTTKKYGVVYEQLDSGNNTYVLRA